jgi:OOP family OmpA-OmpF porin
MRLSVKLGFILATSSLVILTGCKQKNSPAPTSDSATVASPVNVSTTNLDNSAKPIPADSGAGTFDINAIPVSNSQMPAFPYLDWPKGLSENSQYVNKKSDFDRLYVIAGNQLLAVEGRFEDRKYSHADMHLSQLASERNYEAAIEALGGVKVNTVAPDNPDFVKKNGGDYNSLSFNKLKRSVAGDVYSVYLIRKPDQNIWIVLSIDNQWTQILTLEERPMKQIVSALSADDMQAELTAKGRVALYVNFDTDKAALRQDSQPTVDEIVKLLNRDPQLKLSIEGHTDNSGNEQHNKTLSKQRAEAVVKALIDRKIAADRLSAAGFGSDVPIADNGTDAGRGKNRRVELVKDGKKN